MRHVGSEGGEALLVALLADVDMVLPVSEDAVDEESQAVRGREESDRAALLWNGMRQQAAPKALLERVDDKAAGAKEGPTASLPRHRRGEV